jgi:hypothetical protein
LGFVRNKIARREINAKKNNKIKNKKEREREKKRKLQSQQTGRETV